MGTCDTSMAREQPDYNINDHYKNDKQPDWHYIHKCRQRTARLQYKLLL